MTQAFPLKAAPQERRTDTEGAGGGAPLFRAADAALAGSAVVLAIAVGVFLLRLPLMAAAFLHLLVVVFLARRNGFGAASAVSIVAVPEHCNATFA